MVWSHDTFSLTLSRLCNLSGPQQQVVATVQLTAPTPHREQPPATGSSPHPPAGGTHRKLRKTLHSDYGQLFAFKGYTFGMNSIKGYTFGRNIIKGYTFGRNSIKGYTFCRNSIKGYTFGRNSIKGYTFGRNSMKGQGDKKARA